MLESPEPTPAQVLSFVPYPHTNMRKTYMTIAGIITTLIVLLSGLSFIALGNAESPADALLRQAYELRTQARRLNCASIGEKVASCYAKPVDGCAKDIAASSAWFLNEYGQTHDVACLSEDLPFGVGGK